MTGFSDFSSEVTTGFCQSSPEETSEIISDTTSDVRISGPAISDERVGGVKTQPHKPSDAASTGTM